MVLKKSIIFIIIFIFILLGNILNFSLLQENNSLKQELSKKAVFIYSDNFETLKEISNVLKENFGTYKTIFFNKELNFLNKVERKLKTDLFTIPILNEINFSLNTNITDELVEEFKLQDYKKYISESAFPNYLKISFNGYVFNNKYKKDFFDIYEIYKDVVSISVKKDYFEESLNKISRNKKRNCFVNIMYYILLFFSIIIYKSYCATNEKHLIKIREKIKISVSKINYSTIIFNLCIMMLPILSFSLYFYYYLKEGYQVYYFDLIYYFCVFMAQFLLVIFALLISKIFLNYLEN